MILDPTEYFCICSLKDLDAEAKTLLGSPRELLINKLTVDVGKSVEGSTKELSMPLVLTSARVGVQADAVCIGRDGLLSVPCVADCPLSRCKVFAWCQGDWGRSDFQYWVAERLLCHKKHSHSQHLGFPGFCFYVMPTYQDSITE